jgi:hypothetical protein
MMYLALEKSSGGKFVGKMSNMNGCDRGDEAKAGACVVCGVMRGPKGPRKVTLDGKDIPFKFDPATRALSIEFHDLWGEHALEIER